MDANALHNEIMRIVIGGKNFDSQPFRLMSFGGGYKICSLNDGRALTFPKAQQGLKAFRKAKIRYGKLSPAMAGTLC